MIKSNQINKIVAALVILVLTANQITWSYPPETSSLRPTGNSIHSALELAFLFRLNEAIVIEIDEYGTDVNAMNAGGKISDLVRPIASEGRPKFLKVGKASDIELGYNSIYKHWLLYGGFLNACIKAQIRKVLEKRSAGKVGQKTWIGLPLFAINKTCNRHDGTGNVPICDDMASIPDLIAANSKPGNISSGQLEHIEKPRYFLDFAYDPALKIIIRKDGRVLRTLNEDGVFTFILDFYTSKESMYKNAFAGDIQKPSSAGMGIAEIKAKVREIIEVHAPDLNTEPFVESLSNYIKALPRHGYIDLLKHVHTDIYLRAKEVVIYRALADDALQGVVTELIEDLIKKGLIVVKFTPPSALKLPPEQRETIPRVTVSQDEKDFAFGEEYRRVVEKCIGVDEEDCDWNYILVNGELFKEPVGFSGQWILISNSEKKLLQHESIRVLKSFGLMLGHFAQIEDNSFEVILQDGHPRPTESESIIFNDIFVMTVGGDGIIRFYLSSNFLNASFIAQRRLCYESFQAIGSLEESMKEQAKVIGKEPSRPAYSDIETKKKVVFLCDAAYSSKITLLAPPPAYHYLAAELTKRGIETEIHYTTDGKNLIIPEEKNNGTFALQMPEGSPGLRPPTIEALTEREDIGLFAFLSVCEDSYHLYKRAALSIKDNSKIPIIAGGPFFTLAPEHAFAHFPEVTASIRGEAEDVIADLAISLIKIGIAEHVNQDSLRTLSAMDNLMFSSDNVTICNNIAQQRIVDINNVALIESDFSFLGPGELQYDLMISFSRGCPHRCKWCARVHKRGPRRMSVDNKMRVLENYRSRIEEVGATLALGERLPNACRTIYVYDDDMLLHRESAMEFLERFAKLHHDANFLLKNIQTSIPSLLSNERDEQGYRYIDTELLDCIKRYEKMFVEGKGRLVLGTDAVILKEIMRQLKGQVIDNGKPGYFPQEVARIVDACEDREISNYHYMVLSNIETSWDDFFDTLYMVFDIGYGKEHFQLNKPPNMTVSSCYTSDSYKQIAENELTGQLLVDIEPMNPSFEEFAYPIVDIDIPPKLGEVSFVYDLWPGFHYYFTMSSNSSFGGKKLGTLGGASMEIIIKMLSFQLETYRNPVLAEALRISRATLARIEAEKVKRAGGEVGGVRELSPDETKPSSAGTKWSARVDGDQLVMRDRLSRRYEYYKLDNADAHIAAKRLESFVSRYDKVRMWVFDIDGVISADLIPFLAGILDDDQILVINTGRRHEITTGLEDAILSAQETVNGRFFSFYENGAWGIDHKAGKEIILTEDIFGIESQRLINDYLRSLDIFMDENGTIFETADECLGLPVVGGTGYKRFGCALFVREGLYRSSMLREWAKAVPALIKARFPGLPELSAHATSTGIDICLSTVHKGIPIDKLMEDMDITENEVVTMDDKGRGNGRAMLEMPNGFCVQDFDPESQFQIAISQVIGMGEQRAAKWILEHFGPKPSKKQHRADIVLPYIPTIEEAIPNATIADAKRLCPGRQCLIDILIKSAA
ncbi:hypothetical protein ACFL0T_06635 [Candidatus Omnitrophota bacterium]